MIDRVKKTKTFYNTEIPDDWDIVEISKIGKVSTGNTPDTSSSDNYGDKFLFVGPGDLNDTKYILKTEKRLSKKGFLNSRIFPKGSILFTCIGSTIGKSGIASVDLTGNQQLNAITVNEDNCNEFIYYQLENIVGRIKLLAGEQAVPIINKNDFQSIKLPRASLPEQKAIAAVLSTWDDAIHKTEQLITQKELRKKWLMQQLLTGKKRLKGFKKSIGYHKTDLGLAMPIDWTIVKVKDIFNERKETSKDQLAYPLYSLTIEKGLTEKTDRYERSFLLKNMEENQYKLIYPNDILFNPMNLRFGAIAKSKIDQIVTVSAYYNSIYLKEINADVNYYEALFKTPLFINLYDRIAIGSLIEKKRVHLSNFIELEIPLPGKEEQTAIAQVLQAADKEITLLRAKADKLREQKKGLMQMLLTGKKRLKI